MHYIRPIFYLFVLIAIGLCSSCDSGSTAQKVKVVSKDGVELIFPLNIQKGGEYNSLQEIRTQTRAMIDFRKKESPEVYSMVTGDYWSPEFVFDGSKMSKTNQYAGFWIDFNDDFTYEYGYYDSTQGSGKYHFRLSDFAMLMLDDNDDLEPKVWAANHNGDVMVFVGKHDFEINNGMQIKMIPLSQKPSK